MIYHNFKLVLEEEVIENAFIEIENGKIKSFGENTSNKIGVDLNNKTLMPGFIDGHIHGALGCDFMDANEESLSKILSYLPSEGVTSVLATTMTDTVKNLKNVIDVISSYKTNQKETKLAGIHLEGPFINKGKKGAQKASNIMSLDVDKFEMIRNNTGKIKVVTYAIENDENFEFTTHLINLGIKGSIGHSNAKVSCCNKCFELGVSRVTHLYNAMSGFNHREPGVVVGAFLNKMLCELIVDKVHVDSDVVNATFKILGADKIALITDAMNAKGLGNGTFIFGGQTVNVNEGKALLESGVLAGSTLKYDEGVRNMKEITSCSLSELSKVSSVNQSKDLKLSTGQIKEGFDADFVVLDNDLTVLKTIINGNIIYETA